MLDRIIPFQLLEVINGIATPLFLFLTIFIVLRIAARAREYGWRFRSFYPAIDAQLAILTIVVGDLLIRSTIWFSRYMVSHQHWQEIEASTGSAIGLIMFGTILLIVGVLCFIRIVTIERTGNWLWISIGVFSIAFGFGMTLL